LLRQEVKRKWKSDIIFSTGTFKEYAVMSPLVAFWLAVQIAL